MVAPDVVRIRDEDGRVVATCTGPTADGACPMRTEDGPVACAGRVVQPVQAQGRAGWQLRVARDAAACPLQSGRVWARQPGWRWGPTTTT